MDPFAYEAILLDSSDKSTNFIPIFVAIFLCIIIPMITRKKEETAILKLINKRKNIEEKAEMTELAKGFVGKDCIIYLFNGNQNTGVIKEVNGNALLVDNDGTQEIINLDFVSRIREYPKKKNGKKKSVVLD